MTGDEPAPPPDEVPPSRLLMSLAAIAAVLLVAAAVLGWVVRQDRTEEQAREDALEAAQLAAVEVLSYDHRRIEEDIEQAERLGTGEFLEQYRAATEGLAGQAAAGEVVVTTTVQGASVQSASRDRVEVLLFVDQTTVRTGLEQPRVEQNRVRLTLDDVDGRWLVSGLDAL
ncbi:MAG TPA: hypothetical protein VNU26_13535 [Mycobacteriales bacterium]|nr:hypothetical protein [Mycobacteriales bacterium]